MSRSTNNPLARLLLRRLGQMLPTAFLTTVMTFLLIHLVPGGPADALLSVSSTDIDPAVINQRLGLDKPLHEQYWHWLTGVLRGDLGTSLVNGAPVADQILYRLPVSLELVGLALIMSAAVAVPLGAWTAQRGGRRSDGAIRAASGMGLAVPDFFLAIVLIDVFAVGLSLFPALGYVPFSRNPAENLQHLALPATALAAGAAAVVVRQVRAAMIDELSSEYVRSARAMGLTERTVVWRYAFRNILPTLLTVYGLLAIGMLGATVLQEQIFMLPGMSGALVTAIETRDYPMLQGIVLSYVAIVLGLNLVIDLANVWLTPRLRSEAH
ncbi:ABC transporter permease [Nocardia sp. NPDC050710]|uniref:ABC transporter permease n=1 Tax=Nocardia sp. NPDC050710 TaxID=3157220 RepID=UPI0033CFF7C5